MTMATQLIYDYDALVRLIVRIEQAEIASCGLNEDATALLAKLRRIRFNMPRGVTVAIDLDELAKVIGL